MDNKKISKLPVISSYKPQSGLLKPLIMALIIVGLGFGGGWLGARTYLRNPSSSAGSHYVTSQSQLIANIAKTVGPSVVSIDTSSRVVSTDFYGFSQVSNQQAAGTGIIINASGIIMTNRHVVPAGTTSVNVTLADGTRYTGVQVLGRTSGSSSLDVAFLKIGNLKGHKLTAVKLGDSSTVQVGDQVVAIGNALGQFQNTVTSGIVSGYGREVTAGDQTGTSTENLTDLIQTDAAINEGNSGGPLVNMSGEVIGMNTAVAGGAQNIGFSIPINDTKGLIAGVLKTGKLAQAYLGVHYVTLTPDVAFSYNLNVQQGAYVVPSSDGQPSVVAGSPADKAGLQEKDIITKVNGVALDDRTSLASALSRYQPGDQVTLTIIRSGKTISVSVTLGNTPS